MKKILVLLIVLSALLFAQVEKSEVLPERDHTFTLDEKAVYTARYAEANVIDAVHPNKFRMHAEGIVEVLSQKGVAEFVVELGTNKEGMTVPIFSAADKDGKPLPKSMQMTFPCPPRCEVNNVNTALFKEGENYK